MTDDKKSKIGKLIALLFSQKFVEYLGLPITMMTVSQSAGEELWNKISSFHFIFSGIDVNFAQWDKLYIYPIVIHHQYLILAIYNQIL